MIQKFLLSVLVLLSFFNAKAQFSGNALDFDGANDIVIINSVPSVFTNPTTNDFTIEAWVNPRASVFGRILFSQASTSNFVSLGTNAGNVIYFYVIKNGTTISVATTSSIPQNQWTHLAARWISATSTAEVFFNGVLQPVVSGGTSSTGTSGSTAIGSRTGGGQYFNGLLDELRVWNTALTPCQILANMNNTLPATQANLVMNYNFNQGAAGGTNTSVTALPDLSGNAYTGTLTNFALSGTTSNWISSTASVTSSGYSNTSVSATSSQTNVTCNGANNGLATVTASGVGPFTYTWMPVGGNAATANGLSAGSYTVAIANSCATITKTLTITQPAMLTLSATVSSSTLCAGNAATLTATASGGTGTITYSWVAGAASNTLVITPTSTSMYTVNATDGNNCTASSTINVQVNALPSVSLTAATATACVNSGSIALTGSPAGGVYSGTNVSGTVFTPATSGTFTPAYSFTNSATGCSNTANTSIAVSLCTGIDVITRSDETIINVYPNPTSGLTTIELSTAAGIEIMNDVGQVIMRETMDEGKHNLDLSNEAAGIYILKVLKDGKQHTMKVMKQ